MFVHAKYTSSMAACYDNGVSDVTAPHVQSNRDDKMNIHKTQDRSFCLSLAHNAIHIQESNTSYKRIVIIVICI